MKTIPFVLYGGETTAEGTQSGIETKRREKAAIRFLIKHRWRVAYMLLGAGIRPDKPDYPQLKEVMKKDLEKVFPTISIITTERDGWGTFKETLAIHQELLDRGENEIYVCSSWYHLPRILFIWWIIARGSIKIHLVAAPSPRLSSLLTELLSFWKVLFSWYEWKH